MSKCFAPVTVANDAAGVIAVRMILQGKVALVTGSTSGIGLAIAEALASEGARLMLNGFGEPAEIAAICERLGAVHDGADMGDPAAIERMVERCTAELGAPDILVNNAGIQHVAPIDEFPVEKWDAIIAINLSAAFHAMRLTMPAMRARGWGRIISTASAHSLVASPNKSAYVAAKHGIAGLTKTVALETAREGITVNCISPGLRLDAAGRAPDTRHDEDPRPDPRAGDRGCAAGCAADETLRHARGGRRARTVPVPRGGAVDHRRQPQRGRRLDGDLVATLDCFATLVMTMRIFALLLVLALAACDAVMQPARLIPEWTRTGGGSRATTTAIGCTNGARRLSLRSRRRGGPAIRRRLLAKARCWSPMPRSAGAIPNGDYRCRVIKLGAQSQGLLDYVAYPAFTCRVSQERDLQRLDKLSGSQRYVGLVFPNDAMRRLFLGALVLGDESRALQYGQDETRNVAGFVERIGPRRWRLIMPKPHFESQMDVMELVPAT